MNSLRLLFPILALAFLFSTVVQAEAPERKTIKFKFNNYFWYKLCSNEPFRGIKIHFRGVRDERPEKALGVVTKRHGNDPIEVYSDPPLQNYVNGYLRGLFKQCGMKLEPKGTPGAPEMVATIKKFRAQEEKGIFTGKGTARSEIEFDIRDGNKKITAQVGYSIEFKKGRKSGIKRLSRTVEELFKETLVQIVNSTQLRNLKTGT